ncbi:hypothetical protein BTA51_02350 [Hahella sp. CCB-MM4]|uniref:LacI family DNA-binding transcriptional regulator n=1 Tax=Hahella sp. (strain CCB-MM4) TaxID=1926491 RepID=UPI000B9B69CA|nr:LacI family DNA-binding transcriptional regulator [Hahella sp. CCB-MM4]OZG75245.1 hypothetical protein BTA51_02350 [Hahella sp. CCB-MM4]
MQDRRVTSEDVARLAGVSRSAVSRTFTPGASVSDTTRDLVVQAARKLGYRPNALARSLTGQQSGLVAVVMAEFTNPYQSQVFYALTQALQKLDKVPMLVTPDETGDINSSMQLVGAYQVDSAIIAAGSLSLQATQICLTMGIPSVLMGRDDPYGKICSVQTDNEMIGQLAADHLLACGATRLGYIGGPPDGQASQEREKGFFEQLRRRGSDPLGYCDNPDYSYQSGFQSALALLKRYPNLDGLFCACDALAFGAMDALRQQRGIHIPEDIQVVGADNVPMADWPGYQLTTISQPIELLTQAVMENLQTILSQGQSLARSRRIMPWLVARATTRS